MQSMRTSLFRAPAAGRALFSTSTPRPLAKMTLLGRLADTPELIPTSTGKELVRYSLGSQYGRPDEEGRRSVSWFRVSYFPENSSTKDYLLSLPKGTSMFVEADARMNSFENQDGNKQMALNLVARNFEVLSKPRPRSGTEADAEVE